MSVSAVTLSAAGTSAPVPSAGPADPILTVRGLSRTFVRRSGLMGRRFSNPALRDVNFDLMPGEILGLVGESGSGKSTIGKIIVGLELPDHGEVTLAGRRILGQDPPVAVPAAQRGIGMIFQDPYSSLNPRMSVGQLVGEGLQIQGHLSRREMSERVGRALEQVGLRASDGERHPHQFSGGQRQRIGIARSIIMDPKVLVADEAVSSLDVSVQMQVLNLLLDIRDRTGLSLIFITHNIAVVEYLCDRVIVLSKGEIVESGDTGSVVGNPQHDYSRKLIAAVPRF